MDSKQSHHIYLDVESKHEFLTNGMLKANIAANVGIFVIAGLMPISYAIFGYPQPQLWRMPLEMQ